MFESMTKVVSQNELKVLVSKHLLTDAIGNNIEKACQGIYPLQNVCYKISQMRPLQYFCLGGIGADRGFAYFTIFLSLSPC